MSGTKVLINLAKGKIKTSNDKRVKMNTLDIIYQKILYLKYSPDGGNEGLEDWQITHDEAIENALKIIEEEMKCQKNKNIRK